ncbi:MAG: succinylglutamate-semialdehyde dehydrogenase [Novosphingobium sp.]|nr:succinylglutamate-semialdehyde dehydrogenase [Novosphingobium sp.]
MSERLRSFDPASGDPVWEGAATSPDAVAQAVEAARAAFPGWAGTPLDERVAHVHAFKVALEARKDMLAELISRETGKTSWEGRGEVSSMIGKVDLSIAAHEERTGERHVAQPFGEAVLRHRPHGVMAVLGPYNFPGHLPNGHIVPALLAGNTVVFKPSELTPAVGEAMIGAWREAGLPDGVIQIVQGGRETGAALAEADIDGLLFTGAAATGAHFRRAFADRPNVILALELGGNNPLIVWDGDVAESAAIAIQSAYVTTGQRCSCARRLIVPDNAFGAQVVDAVADMAGRLRIGAWNETPEPWIGPLISADAVAKATAQVEALKTHGARELLPLSPVEERGAAFVTPALLDMTGHAMPDEEIFAPVLQVRRVATFDEAVAAANDTRFGLSAGLVSEEDALWRRFVHEARAGVVNRNRPTTGASGAMPFGGLGHSGNHRPSAYYAADYCAFPVASFETASAAGNSAALTGMLHP